MTAISKIEPVDDVLCEQVEAPAEKVLDPFDYQGFAKAMAYATFAREEPAPYVPPKPEGSYVEHFLPGHIADDEPDIYAKYDFYPAEARTRDYPGCDAWVEILNVVGIDRQLTDAETKAALGDKRFIEQLEELAFEKMEVESEEYEEPLWERKYRAPVVFGR